jgi:membrane protein DedA with SNARE-associated domain
MNDRLLELLFAYGVAALGPILLLSAIGVPLPGTLLLVAAGAFASGGQLSFWLLLSTAIVATLIGNGIGYWIGLRGGEAATTRWAQRFRVSGDNIARAQGLFARYGGLSVLFTRFPLSPLSAIVNILAGAARYSRRTFALLNLIGVSVWASVYAGLGYAFGASWESISNLLDNVTQVLTLLVVVAILAVVLIRTLRDRQRRRDTPAAPAEEEEHLRV